MLASTLELLLEAQGDRRAIAAFNVYTIEGVRGVVNAAEALGQPIILQAHPGALKHGRWPLIAAMLQAARDAAVPVAVQLDHSTSMDDIAAALKLGVSSVMADGSDLPYEQNVDFVKAAVQLAAANGQSVEGELGKLSGTEDDITVEAYQARLTMPEQAEQFVDHTGVQMLAVCIGNVHGVYRTPPQLDFDRLAAIRARVHVPLVLHGASGLPEDQIQRCIALGICKFNVNTELRHAALEGMRRTLADASSDLGDVIQSSIKAMQAVASQKIRLFSNCS